LMDYSCRPTSPPSTSSISSNNSTITNSSSNTMSSIVECANMMMTADILVYLYHSNIIPISTLVKILISTGRKSTFLYYSACFQLPEFSTVGSRTMFQAIEAFLRSTQIIPLSTSTSEGKLIQANNESTSKNSMNSFTLPENESVWFRDEIILARIDDLFSTDLKSLIVSLHSSS